MNDKIKKMIPQPLFDFLIKIRQNQEVNRWRKTGLPSPMPHRAKQIAIENYQKKFNLKTLVETGTYLGDMVYAMRNKFERIYSIELGIELWKSAVIRFEKFDYITLLQGDSGEKIELVLKQLNQPALFWLDGHYSEGFTAKGRLNTPIVQELQTVLGSNQCKHVLLIDDARCFNGKDDYPNIDELRKMVFDLNPSYKFTLEDDIICITPTIK